MRDDEDRDTRMDEALFAFQIACPRPDAADVVAWVGRHPEFADEIREHAEALLAIAQAPAIAVAPSAALVEQGRGRMLAALARARSTVEPAMTGDAATATLIGLIEGSGSTVAGLARALDIGRAVLTDLVQGRMRAPIPARLAEALAEAVGSSVADVMAAASAAAATPQMGRAKATSPPAARQRSFEEIVRGDTSMADGRKAFWLGEG